MEKFLKKKLAEWEEINSHYRERFLETRDPDVVIEFVKKHYLAIQEGWVQKEMHRWVMRRRYDLIEALVPNKKGKQTDLTEYKIAIRDLWIFDEVNRLEKTGMTQRKAFETLSEKKTIGEALAWDTIRNYYYRARDRKPEIRVKDLGTHFKVSACPTKIETEINGQKQTIYGEWSFEIPKPS